MVEGAPQLLIDIEQSAIAGHIRQSTWVYAAANVGHILSLVVFFAAVAIMDLRLLGWLDDYAPAEIVAPARRVAVAAFLAQATTGAVLFAAEASHVALNPVFQAKMILVALALANALLSARGAGPALSELPAHARLPARLRFAAFASLALWLAVAAAGRLIAYV
jgi:hypothetical protein